jgi:hypothetical protein
MGNQQAINERPPMEEHPQLKNYPNNLNAADHTHRA